MNACIGRVVGYDPDFRKEVGDFLCKAVSNQPSAVSLNQMQPLPRNPSTPGETGDDMSARSIF